MHTRAYLEEKGAGGHPLKNRILHLLSQDPQSTLPRVAKAILNTLRGTSCPGFNAHLALMGGNPDSGGTEFSGSAYSRVPIRFNAPSEQPNGNSQMSNSELVVSPEATGFWGNLTHVSIYDAASNGHPYITIPLSVSYNMIAGTVCQFQVGRFKINVN